MINSPSQQHNKNEKKTEKQLKTGDCGTVAVATHVTRRDTVLAFGD
jgi:hypothetical protein